MITRRLTGAALGLLITLFVAAGFVGPAVASETTGPVDSSPRSKPVLRLAFNAGGLRPFSDLRVLPDQSALAEAKEVEALRQAGEAGDPHAQLNLGLCYESGRGVAKDTAAAIAWFRRAADQGFDEAQYTLGCCYNGEDGFPKDQVAATKWWGKAATQGYADAQYCLGLSYSMGEGVARDPIEAANWWKKAAEQNHANAQYFLGLSYSVGLGVKKIPEQAVYWLRKAATNGNENAVAALKKLGKESDLPARKQSADRLGHGGAEHPVQGTAAAPVASQSN